MDHCFAFFRAHSSTEPRHRFQSFNSSCRSLPITNHVRRHQLADSSATFGDLECLAVRGAVQQLAEPCLCVNRCDALHDEISNYFGEILVPSFSPRITRAMLPCVLRLKTSNGILRSMQR